MDYLISNGGRQDLTMILMTTRHILDKLRKF